MNPVPLPLSAQTLDEAKRQISLFTPEREVPTHTDLLVKRADNPVLVWDEANSEIIDLTTL